MNKKIIIFGLLVTFAFCALVICIAGMFLLPSPPKIAKLSTLTPAVSGAVGQSIREGKATRDLGQQSASFGSINQAEELLKLIEQEPGKLDYQISYKTQEDIVLFGCNFDKDVIIRIHQQPDGHGKQEMWQGYIIERLKFATNGGTLNDTPNGKFLGSMQEF